MSGGADETPLHAACWLAWVGAAAVVLTATRNPWYIGLALLWLGLTRAAVRPHTEDAPQVVLSPGRFALVVVPLATLLNALFVRTGSTRLFVIPERVPLLGGPVTLEAIVYGVLTGLMLVGLFMAFALFQQVTPVRDLIRLAPRAYYPVAVTVAIAVTFVPVTLREAGAIREAQAIRGHRVRGVRSWGPLFLPLLSSGLERALALAEAMVARGFASGAAPPAGGAQLLLVGGLLLFMAGWLLRLVWGVPLAGGGALLAGLLAMGWAIGQAGRSHPHTVYRPAPWRAVDWVVTGAAALTAACFLLPLPGIERSSLAYYPYPTLAMPSFDLVLGLASWGLLGPALVYLVDW